MVEIGTMVELETSIHYIPVVPHEAVAEVSRVRNLQEM